MQLKFIIPAIVAVCAVSAPVQADDMVTITREIGTCLVAVNAKLDTIKDKPSAEAAVPELRKIAEKVVDLTSRAQKVANEGRQPDEKEAATLMGMISKNTEIDMKIQANIVRLTELGVWTPEFAKSIAPEAARQQAPAAQ